MAGRNSKGNIAELTDDLTGRRFGKLVVVALDHLGVNGRCFWRCKCDCGNESVVPASYLVGRGPRSCGCIRPHHGFSRSRTYGIWRGLFHRCYRPVATGFGRYGGKGVSVCDRWRDFRNFLADMGTAPAGMSIDRMRNDRGYEPGNCRWATSAEQMRNTSQNHLVTFHGKTQCLMDWANETGISFRALNGRFARGWPIERALTLPASRSNPRRY